MKVRDYVRTKSGFIDKIININDFREPSMKYALEQPSWNDDVVFIGEEKIKKSSPNIIDLIELGDLVRLFMEDNLDKEDTNIFEVIAITRDKKEIGVFTKDCELDFYPIENLRGIVTKEQFESMEYRIGE